MSEGFRLSIWRRLALGLGLTVLAGCAGPTMVKPGPPPRKIFAHYMGCYPAAAAATAWHRQHDPLQMRHDGNGKFDRIGDRWRNWPLVPEGLRLTREQSADLEIRRALRAGIDGFAIDAWAGGDDAKAMLAALLRVAAEKDYPFEVTICLDGGNVDAIKYLLEHHGDNPKLARRNGRPLIFGYYSALKSSREAFRELQAKGEAPAAETDPALRATKAGWEAAGRAFRNLEKEVGQPLYLHFCLAGQWHQVKRADYRPEMMVDAAGVYARYADAVGEFLGGGDLYDQMAKVVQAHGAEWSEPMFYQYENIGWGGNRIGNGSDILRERWAAARRNHTTLIQWVTWNDYTENTHLSPAYDTRYTIFDLTRYFVDWWKTGEPPRTDHDRVYLIYRKYPKGAKIFPFSPKQPDAGGVLEVLTILTAPATVQLPGRPETWSAPAGLSWHQVPLQPGIVSAALVRHGQEVLRLTSPEPVTDKPFREQNGMVCYSTEFLRHWREDFGDVQPYLHGEYADEDQDGLPNWFEMYWFGKFLDYTTAGIAAPDADPDQDGKTNLEEYRRQTIPRE